MIRLEEQLRASAKKSNLFGQIRPAGQLGKTNVVKPYKNVSRDIVAEDQKRTRNTDREMLVCRKTARVLIKLWDRRMRYLSLDKQKRRTPRQTILAKIAPLNFSSKYTVLAATPRSVSTKDNLNMVAIPNSSCSRSAGLALSDHLGQMLLKQWTV